MTPDDLRHGSYAGVQAHRKADVPLCEPCRLANFRYHKHMKRRLNAGIRSRVPLGHDAWKIIDSHTRTQLHRASGINLNMLCRLHSSGPDTMVLAVTRQRILDARPAFSPLGIQRRLRALTALGYSASHLARLLHCHRDPILRIQRTTPTFVRHDYALRICELYDEIGDAKPEPSRSASRARGRALRRGWWPPAMWDDPDTDPEPAAIRRRNLLAEYRHLRHLGESHEQAVRQLGVTSQAIEKAQLRHRKAA